MRFIFLYFFVQIIFSLNLIAFPEYSWLSNYSSHASISNNISTPPDYKRVSTKKDSYQEWLRNLPLKPIDSKVFLYNKKLKNRQDVHYAVLDLDVGQSDLQQCADSVIRLRAEYLYSIGSYNKIAFQFTSGDTARYKDWRDGYRPLIQKNKVKWTKSKKHDPSYKNFRLYLDTVFMYAGSFSLQKEMNPIGLKNLDIGDVFIQGGFPGHAVVVLDVAVHQKSNDKLFLLAQSYMPAQDMHILINPNQPSLSPWYKISDIKNFLITPEWKFRSNDLHRF